MAGKSGKTEKQTLQTEVLQADVWKMSPWAELKISQVIFLSKGRKLYLPPQRAVTAFNTQHQEI